MNQSDPARADKPIQLYPLTSLRFAAAAYVVFLHFALLSGVHPENGWIDTLLGLGYIGVNFFFILSGFVLAWNYIDEAGRFRVSAKTFWMARFARLYPAYALALLFALPIFVELAATGKPPGPGAPPLDNPWVVLATAITTPLLLQVWFGLLAWNTVAWSLSVEAFFYLTFPAVAPRIGTASRSRLLWLAVIASILPIALSGTVFWEAAAQGRSASWYEFKTLTEAIFYSSPLIHWPEFALGVIAGRLYQLRSAEGRLASWRPAYDYLTAGGTFLLLLATALLPAPIFAAVMAPALALLIFSLAHSSSSLTRVLSLAPLVLLGHASYSLYLFHAIFIQTFVDLAKAWSIEELLSWPVFLLCFVFIVAFTIVVFKRVEEPARDWIRSRLSRKATRSAKQLQSPTLNG